MSLESLLKALKGLFFPLILIFFEARAPLASPAARFLYSPASSLLNSLAVFAAFEYCSSSIFADLKDSLEAVARSFVFSVRFCSPGIAAFKGPDTNKASAAPASLGLSISTFAKGPATAAANPFTVIKISSKAFPSLLKLFGATCVISSILPNLSSA